MLTYGLVVEGVFDAEALAELIRKCVGSNIEVVTRPYGSEGSLMSRFPGFLEEFRYQRQGTHVDKALVVRDAGAKDPGELIQRMEAKIAGRNYQFPVKPFVIVRELETWLLADSGALSTVSGRMVPEINDPLEGIADPKARLQRILSGANPYTQEVARKIAAAADLETIGYRCPSFRSFCETVRDC